jgi:hypothetical protein
MLEVIEPITHQPLFGTQMGRYPHPRVILDHGHLRRRFPGPGVKPGDTAHQKPGDEDEEPSAGFAQGAAA